MPHYRMDNGTIVNTDSASNTWEEETYWDGNNNCSQATHSQWGHQQLYRSRKGRYYIESWSNWQGSVPRAEWVSHQEATRWLLEQEIELPEELEQYRDSIEE